ncbi:DNA polymerase/3'-5' exonuclease PolX [Luteitalea pratensis]|uniref:DNA polymerase/3'-5' exonuclease PolX n=2 Tax=Luteitalea pratensis TaxID=1855912 RepID=A0A143PT15_LUTPR|nr:DNA polymerase/3'-5' exonuclease PolX [Luteitalea pratensis]
MADTLDHMAGLCRALGRAPEAAHWAHLSTSIRRVLDHQPRTPWSLLRRSLDAQGLLALRDSELLERVRRADHDEIAHMQRRLPAGARALIRHGQHPLRHRVADEDVLLEADLERHLPADLVDLLAPEGPEDALVPLGRAWMQAKQVRRELATAAGTPDAWHMVGGLRRTDPVSPDVALLAVTEEPAAWSRRAADALPRDVLVVAGAHAVAVAAEPEPIVVHAVTPESVATSLAWYTGPRGHVRALKARAAAAGLALTREALLDGSTAVPLADEGALYTRLDLPFIAVELRSRPNVIEAALAGTLPTLLEVEDIRGDLHMHTVYSDGRDSVAGMVHAARALGYGYMAITDHSPTAKASRVLTLERIAEQAGEIAAVRALVPGITILHGIECDIQEDGSLDVPDAVLERLDIVLASLHESHGHSPARLLQRYERVMRHPLVNVITHPANRSPGRQPGYSLAFERLFEHAARTGTAVEIDGAPGHLDLDSPLAETAAAIGAPMLVDSDCHMADRLGRQMRFGVGLARRAGITKAQVLNTRDVSAIRDFVAAKRQGRPWQA